MVKRGYNRSGDSQSEVLTAELAAITVDYKIVTLRAQILLKEQRSEQGLSEKELGKLGLK
ncbi:hypothetical protein ES708_22340 [subsurface metagenome]